MWIAILDKKVVAYREELTEEKEESLRQIAEKPPVIFFVGTEARILYE